eukprot:RCo015185
MSPIVHICDLVFRFPFGYPFFPPVAHVCTASSFWKRSLKMFLVSAALVGFSLLSLTHAYCPPVPACAVPPRFVRGQTPAKGTVVKKTVQFVIDDAPGTAHDLY